MGKLKAVKDRFGNQLAVGYTSGLITSVTDNTTGSVTKLTFHHDGNGNIDQITDYLSGQTWNFTYIQKDGTKWYLNTVKAPTLVQATATTLNGAINSSTTTVAVLGAEDLPLTTPFVIRIGSEDMLVTGGGTSLTVERGYNNTTEASHSSGAAISIVDALFVNYDYANFGHEDDNENVHRVLASVDEANGDEVTVSQTKFDYYHTGQAMSLTDREGGVTHYSYDTLNRVTTVTDPNGNTSFHRFDAFGRPLEDRNADRTRTVKEWDTSRLSLQTAEVDAFGFRQTLEYFIGSDVNKGYSKGKGSVRRTVAEQADVTPESGEVQVNLVTEFAYWQPGDTGYGSGHSVQAVKTVTTQREATFQNQTVIAEDLDTTETDVDVSNSSNLPAVDSDNSTIDFYVIIDSEQMAVKHKSGNTLTVTRAVNGTTAAAHSNGADIIANQTVIAEDLDTTETGVDVANGSNLPAVDSDSSTIDFYVIVDSEQMAVKHKSGNTLTVTRAANGSTAAAHSNGADIMATFSTSDARTTTYEYASSPTAGQRANPISITDTLGNETTYTWTTQGRVASVTAPRGNVQGATGDFTTTYQYDSSFGKITKQTLPDLDGAGGSAAGEFNYHYDSRGNLDWMTDPTGVKTEFAYDLLDRVIEQRLVTPRDVQNEKAVTAFVYDIVGNVLETVGPTGYATTNVYNRRGQLIESQNAVGALTKFAFDASGNLISSTDPLGQTTNFVYDARNRIVQSVMADGTVSFTDFDGASRPVTQIAANGATTKTSYGRMGRAEQVIDALGNDVVQEYDVFSNVIKTTDARGNYTEFKYDSLNRLIESRSYEGSTSTVLAASTIDYSSYPTQGIVKQTAYELTGLSPIPADLTTVDASRKRTVETKYDALDRVIEVKDAAGNTSSTTYDLAGRVKTQMDAEGRVLENTYYAGSGWLKETELPAPEAGSPQPTTTLEYDLMGNVTKTTLTVSATADQEATLTYDAMNRAVTTTKKVTVTESVTTSTLFNVAGQVVSQVDALGRANFVEYDAMGRKVRETLPDPDREGNQASPVLRYAYDDIGNLTTFTDALGRVTSHEYDLMNRMISKTLPDPDGAGTGDPAPVLEWEYDEVGNLTKVIDALDHETEYLYDGLNRRTTIIQADPTLGTTRDEEDDIIGAQTVTAYDTLGNVVSVTDALERVTKYEYDLLNRLTATVQPDPITGLATGARTTLTYDDVGNLLTSTNALGQVTTYEYDELNRRTKVIAPNPRTGLAGDEESTTTTEYDLVGNVVLVIDALGRETAYEYDFLNRRNKVTLPNPETGSVTNGIVTETVYDEVGNVFQVIQLPGDPLENVTQYEYDELNRRISTTLPDPETGDPNGPVTTVTYDAVGNVVTVTDALGRVTGTDYDNLNRRITVTLADGSETTYKYDLDGKLRFVTDTLERVTETIYDALNRVKKVILPDPETGEAEGPSTTTTYDAVGNVLTVTDDLERVTSFGYDALNRRIRTTLPDAVTGLATGATSRVEFDAIGNQISTTDALGRVTQYEYDGQNRLSAVTAPHPNDVTMTGPRTVYEYDAVGNVVHTIDPLGRDTVTVYDALNRRIQIILPDAVTGDATGATTTWEYDELGRLDFVTDALGRVTSYEYDLLGRQTAVVLPHATNPNLDGLRTESEYDSVGNLILQTVVLAGDDQKTAFEYDLLNRRVATVLADPETGLAEGPRSTVTYDAAGNVVAATDALGRTTTYEYDGLNRRTKVVLPHSVYDDFDGAELTTEYDSVGNVVSQTDARGSQTAYEYDALNRQIAVIQPDAATGTATGARSTTEYDLVGQIIRTTDALGRQAAFFYDRLGRRTLQVLPDPDTGLAEGPETEWQYDFVGNVTLVIDARGAETAYEYDALNRQVAVVLPNKDDGDADGLRTETIYDLIGNQIEMRVGTSATDTDKRVTEYRYDRLNRLTDVLLPNPDATLQNDRPQTHTDYDEIGNIDLDTDALGAQTDYIYDDLNRQIAVVRPDEYGAPEGLRTEFEYDSVGNLLRQTDVGPERTTEFVYDRLNRKTIQVLPHKDTGDADGVTLSWEYDVAGNLVLETGLLGQQTAYEYDALGRQTAVVQADATTGLATGGRTTFAYDLIGNQISTTDALGRITTFVYDKLNRLEQQIAPNPNTGLPTNGLVTEYHYDELGNQTEVIDAEGQTTTTQYDFLNRAIAHVLPDPDGASSKLAPKTTYVFDVYGDLDEERRWVSATEYEATNYDYDRLNRQITVTDPNSEVTRYTFDLAGQQLSVTDAENNVTSFTYDKLGRLKTETNALGKSRTYEYDADSNVDRITDRNGRVRDFDYDKLNRMTAEKWMDGVTVVHQFDFTYNNAGQVLTQDDSVFSRTYTYDKLGRLQTDSNEGTFDGPEMVFTYQYDLVGNVTSRAQTIDGQAGPTDSYQYYATNWLKQQDQSGGGITAKRVTYTYNDIGQFDLIVRSTVSGGTPTEVVTSDYDYDFAHRLTDLVHKQGSTTLASYEYDYDQASRLLSQTSAADGAETFTYDDLGQLETTDRTGTSNDESYDYDGTGNRINSGYQTGANNRLERSPNGADQFTYSYDGEGNRLSRGSTNVSQGSIEYQWDYRDRLEKVTFKNSSGTVTKTVTYQYDANDLRIAKFVDSDGDTDTDTSEWFVNDGRQVVYGQFGDPPPPVGPWNGGAHFYLHGPEVDQVFADDHSVAGILWALSDVTGTVRDVAVLDGSTTTIPTDNHRVFDSFGNLKNPDTLDGGFKDDFAYGFTGREYDADAQLSYHRARWYDPNVGRWISEDPIGFAGGDTNVNRYVNNNPTIYTDPSGMFLDDLWDWVEDLDDKAEDLFKDGIDAFKDFYTWTGEWTGRHWIEDQLQDIGHSIEDAAVDVGDFFEEQWENGNIQRALMAAQLVYGIVTMNPLLIANGLVSHYETYSGDQIGDGTLSKVLGATTMIYGGFQGASNVAATNLIGQAAKASSIALGYAGAIETATGNQIGDGTLTNVLNGVFLATGVATMTPGTAWGRAGRNMQLISGTASIASSYIAPNNKQLNAAFRNISIASSLWSLGSTVVNTGVAWNDRYGRQDDPNDTYVMDTSGHAHVSDGGGGGQFSVPSEPVPSASGWRPTRRAGFDPLIDGFLFAETGADPLYSPSPEALSFGMGLDAPSETQHFFSLGDFQFGSGEEDNWWAYAWSEAGEYKPLPSYGPPGETREQALQGHLEDAKLQGNQQRVADIQRAMQIEANEKLGLHPDHQTFKKMEQQVREQRLDRWSISNIVGNTVTGKMPAELVAASMGATREELVNGVLYMGSGGRPDFDPAEVAWGDRFVAEFFVDEVSTAGFGLLAKGALKAGGYGFDAARYAFAGGGRNAHSALQIRRIDFNGLEAISETQLRDFGFEIAGNSRASSLYNQVTRNGVDIDLSFAPIQRTPDGNIIPGVFDQYPRPGRITIFGRAQPSVGDALGTFGHEARHALDSLNGLPLQTRGSEYRAFVEEFIVRQGRVPNRSEMGVLAREVNQLYPHLPTDTRVIRISGY